jgi:integrative and conjugative element protein (TIGR02256 family)
MYAINKITEKEKYCFLIISKSAQDIFFKYRQTKDTHTEACGVLIGNHKVDGKTIHLKIATTPQVKDKRRRHSFELDSASHQNILDSHFKVSENEDVYLGTWHTHPEIIPTPSNNDIADWNKQYMANIKLFNRMIFTIVGINKTRFWMIEKNKLFEILERKILYDKNN